MNTARFTKNSSGITDKTVNSQGDIRSDQITLCCRFSVARKSIQESLAVKPGSYTSSEKIREKSSVMGRKSHNRLLHGIHLNIATQAPDTASPCVEGRVTW
jgi:hypothetical protein